MSIKFTMDAFEITAKKNFSKFLIRYRNSRNLNFLEIGSFEGMATLWLLENILTDSTSKITTIDTFEHKAFSEDTPEIIKKRLEDNLEKHKDKVTILEGKSQEILKDIKEEFDFVYIDGSHTTPNTLEDAILSFRLLKKNRLMIFDDYKWDYYKDHLLNPRLGIDYFLKAFEGQYHLLLKDYQVVIRKI